ncbi:alpha/beta hydrolase fold-domain-containing protein [Mycena olivaceomarginata]|nr:alpha/beta hydrolase fold-domain-containing protein [Mycena olivaceomarginata]
MSKDLQRSYAPLRNPILKVPYLTFELLTALVRVPYWALISIPRVGDFKAPPNYLTLVPGTGYHGVWVDPVPQDRVLGKVAMWTSVAGVEPVRLPGYWIHQPGTVALEAPLLPDEKIVASTGPSPSNTASPPPRRSPTAHPFPTALIDALTGYHYLVSTLRIPPASIVFMGDSAGGNLALALVRYLVEHPVPNLPPPGALLLLSPWVDLGTSHETPNSSLTTCAASDFLVPPIGPPARTTSNFLHWSIRAFTGPLGLGAAETNTYISPASRHLDNVSFAGFPRTFISAGGAEILLDSIRTLNERMSRDLGEGVRYLEAADSVHDFLLIPKLQEPQRGETLAAIAEWVAEA